MTELTVLTDETLRQYYEQIREQVSADNRSGLRFMGSEAKARADLLLAEIQRRGLNIAPIAWGDCTEGSLVHLPLSDRLMRVTIPSQARSSRAG
jgi:hypothetical protein